METLTVVDAADRVLRRVISWTQSTPHGDVLCCAGLSSGGEHWLHVYGLCGQRLARGDLSGSPIDIGTANRFIWSDFSCDRLGHVTLDMIGAAAAGAIRAAQIPCGYYSRRRRR